MTNSEHQWDPGLYESRHSFVWAAGKGLLDALDPQPDEHIFDVGCGTGQLTAEIAGRGAKVVGIDSSADMIARARANYPDITFAIDDACSFTAPWPLDAIFSNAALHWVLDARAAAKAMHHALRPEGRLVLEMGGSGNIATISNSIRRALNRLGLDYMIVPKFHYFPTVGEYTSVLEEAGFEVRNVLFFDRPTPLEGAEEGLRNWIRQFKTPYLNLVASEQQEEFFALVEAFARPHLYREEGWFADYRRLRVQALALK